MEYLGEGGGGKAFYQASPILTRQSRSMVGRCDGGEGGSVVYLSWSASGTPF